MFFILDPKKLLRQAAANWPLCMIWNKRWIEQVLYMFLAVNIPKI